MTDNDRTEQLAEWLIGTWMIASDDAPDMADKILASSWLAEHDAATSGSAVRELATLKTKLKLADEAYYAEESHCRELSDELTLTEQALATARAELQIAKSDLAEARTQIAWQETQLASLRERLEHAERINAVIEGKP